MEATASVGYFVDFVSFLSRLVLESQTDDRFHTGVDIPGYISATWNKRRVHFVGHKNLLEVADCAEMRETQNTNPSFRTRMPPFCVPLKLFSKEDK